MTKTEALEYAKRSAFVASDNGEIAAHRDDVIDTLNDSGAGEFVNDALSLYDKLTAN